VLVSLIIVIGLLAAVACAPKQAPLPPPASITFEDLSRTAFIETDFDNDCCKPEGKIAGSYEMQQERETVKHAQAALEASREAGVYVIHVCHETREIPATVDKTFPNIFAYMDEVTGGGIMEGTWGAAVIDELAPLPGEPIVVKRGISGFYGTDLDRILRTHDINTIVVAGIIINMAVEGLVREAVDRGYHVIVLEDCCASNTVEMHDFFFNYCPLLCVVSDSTEYIKALEAK